MYSMMFTKHIQNIIKRNIMFLPFVVSASCFAASVGEVSIYLPGFFFF